MPVYNHCSSSTACSGQDSPFERLSDMVSAAGNILIWTSPKTLLDRLYICEAIHVENISRIIYKLHFPLTSGMGLEYLVE